MGTEGSNPSVSAERNNRPPGRFFRSPEPGGSEAFLGPPLSSQPQCAISLLAPTCNRALWMRLSRGVKSPTYTSRRPSAAVLPMLIVCLLPLAAAIVVGALAGHPEHVSVGALVTVVALVALSCIVEVVVHERVGYAHTLSALNLRD